MEQQLQPGSNNAASLSSAVTLDQQLQQGSNNAPSGSPPVQQQSQSKSPYFKFTLPYDGIVTCTVSVKPSSPQSPGSHEDKSSEQGVPNTTSENSNNDGDDHNGAASGVIDIEESIAEIQSDYVVIKFVFVGDAATGKTSLLERYSNNKFSIASQQTTIVDVKSKELMCYKNKYKLHLWDTAGQERFRALGKSYYQDAVGAFVVYDITNRESLDHCLQWKKEIDDAVQLSNGDPIPIVLIANKVDCPCDDPCDGEEFSKEHGFVDYFKTSAKTGVGIKEAVHCMVKMVHQLSSASTNQEPVIQTVSRNRTSSIKLHFNQENDKSKRKCCRH